MDRDLRICVAGHPDLTKLRGTIGFAPTRSTDEILGDVIAQMTAAA